MGENWVRIAPNMGEIFRPKVRKLPPKLADSPLSVAGCRGQSERY